MLIRFIQGERNWFSTACSFVAVLMLIFLWCSMSQRNHVIYKDNIIDKLSCKKSIVICLVKTVQSQIKEKL